MINIDELLNDIVKKVEEYNKRIEDMRMPDIPKNKKSFIRKKVKKAYGSSI